jgi:DNA-directed RNA polymerase specialized sigma24 family protein
MVTAGRLSRARAGDEEAFRELAESHRRELQVHCYRMLGSVQDAEDAVQETMLAAWQGIRGFPDLGVLRAPRGALLYSPRSGYGLEEVSLDLMADP